MKHLFLLGALLSISGSLLSMHASDIPESFDDIATLYQDGKLTREKAIAFLDKLKDFGIADGERFCLQAEIKSIKVLQDNAWATIDELENTAVALCVLRECQKYLYLSCGKQDKHGDGYVKMHEIGREFCIQALPRIIEHAEKSEHVYQIKEGLQALEAYSLFATHGIAFLIHNLTMENYHKQKKASIEKHLKEIQCVGYPLIKQFREGTLNFKAGKWLWNQDKEKILASEASTKKLCTEFCDLYKEEIVRKAQSLSASTFAECENVLAALWYLHGCEALLSPEVLVGRTLSAAQEAGHVLLAAHKDLMDRHINAAKSVHANKETMRLGDTACQFYALFGPQSEKRSYEALHGELQERLSQKKAPTFDDFKSKKTPEHYVRSTIRSGSALKLQRIVTVGFALAALTIIGIFAYKKYTTKNKAQLKPQPTR